MAQQHRLNNLLEMVSDRGNVSISDITEALNVSPATARRDLSVLAEQRLVTRTHGGATALGTGYELPLQYKFARQADAKLAIARAAVELIAPGSIVGLNGGTTTSEVARAIARNDRLIRSDGDVGISIVTNALNIAFELSIRPHVKIVVTGGVARRQSYELVGPLVSNILSDVVLDVAILGVDGLSAQFGATTLNEGEAAVSRELARVANRVIIVADSTKMGKTTFARIFELQAIDVLVTDAQLDAGFANDLASANIEVLIAGLDAPPVK